MEGALQIAIDKDFIQKTRSRSCVCISRTMLIERETKVYHGAERFTEVDGQKYMVNCVEALLEIVRIDAT